MQEDKKISKNRIIPNDIDLTPYPESQYPNPLIISTLDEFKTNELFKSTFHHFDDMITNSKAFKGENIELSPGYITRFATRDWKTNYDLQFELFKRILNTDQFIFFQFACNTGKQGEGFSKSLYTLYCFRLPEAPGKPQTHVIKEALAKVDHGKWKDYELAEVEKFYSLFDYVLTNPQQESCTMRIRKGDVEKHVVMAYTVEEDYNAICPACLLEL
jgi:hypothetical protein